MTLARQKEAPHYRRMRRVVRCYPCFNHAICWSFIILEVAQSEGGITVLKSWKTDQPQFLAIWTAEIALFLLSPILARGSVSGGSILIVFCFASILAIAAVGQTLVIRQERQLPTSRQEP